MIKKINSSLTLRIFIITCLLLILLSSITYGIITFTLPPAYTSQLNDTLDKRVEQLVDQLSDVTFDESHRLLDHFLVDNDVTLSFIYPDGQIGDPPSNLNVNGDSDTGPEVSTDTAIEYYSSADSDNTTAPHEKKYPIHFKDSDEPYILLVSGNWETVNQVSVVLLKILPWFVCVIVLISALFAFLYSRHITKPIIDISRVSQKMSRMELDWQCNYKRRDEIGVLAGSLDEMAHKLSAAFYELQSANLALQNDIDREKELERQRMDFFSAVSHELKTPITILDGQIEGMLKNHGSYKDRDKYLARSLNVIQSMKNLVQEILTISRMDTSGFALKLEIIDFSELVREKFAEYIELFDQKELQFAADISDAVKIKADRTLLEKVISNLIGNAIRHSPEHEAVFIKVYSENGKAGFSVHNTGISIPDEALPYLFEPFYRVDSSRSRQTGGSGLGLYLVSRILMLHGASYHIQNAASGVQFQFLL